MTTGRVQLIHWNAEEARERAKRLRAVGYEVDHEISGGSSILREMGRNPPAAIVVDLSRLPSQGRDIALLIRRTKATRDIPLVFIGGVPEKVARIQELLPDAEYTSWARIGDVLAEAMANPPVDPVVPASQFAAYAGKPLTEKLGIQEDSVVGLIAAPPGFQETLGTLPDGAQLGAQPSGECNLFIWFACSRAELEKDVPEMAALTAHGPLWIAWPKKASGVVSDLTQPQVREVGLAAGLVDYKICSIDKTWSGLLFTQRKPK
jgi:CheY-like chemotaxis protein